MLRESILTGRIKMNEFKGRNNKQIEVKNRRMGRNKVKERTNTMNELVKNEVM